MMDVVLGHCSALEGVGPGTASKTNIQPTVPVQGHKCGSNEVIRKMVKYVSKKLVD